MASQEVLQKIDPNHLLIFLDSMMPTRRKLEMLLRLIKLLRKLESASLIRKRLTLKTSTALGKIKRANMIEFRIQQDPRCSPTVVMLITEPSLISLRITMMLKLTKLVKTRPETFKT
jgi:hypothetical protein